MGSEIASIESRIDKVIQQHEEEWLVMCGLKNASYNEMLEILRILRNVGLHELEAMLIWKMEYQELDEVK